LPVGCGRSRYEGQVNTRTRKTHHRRSNRRLATPLLISVVAALLSSLLISSPSSSALQTLRGEREEVSTLGGSDPREGPDVSGPAADGSGTSGGGELASCDSRVIESDPDIGGEVLDATSARVRTAVRTETSREGSEAVEPGTLELENAATESPRGIRETPGLDVFDGVSVIDGSSVSGSTSTAPGGVLVASGSGSASDSTTELPASLWFDPTRSYRYEYVAVTDAWALIPAVEVATDHEVTAGETTPMTVTPDSMTGEASAVRTHSRLWAEVVLTAVGPRAGGGEWINAEISAACSRVWSEQRTLDGATLASLADVTVPTGDPDRVEDTSPQHRGSFQFARTPEGEIIEIVHDEAVAGDLLMFREGFVNSLAVDLDAASTEATVAEMDRTAAQQSAYVKDRDLDGPVVSRTASVPELGLERRADIGLGDDGVVRKVQSRDEMTLTSTALPSVGQSEPHDDRDVPWADGSWQPAPATGAASPVDSYVVSISNLGLVTTQPVAPNLVSDAMAAVAAPALRNTLDPAVAHSQVDQIAVEKAQSRFDQAVELLASTPASEQARDAIRPEIIRLMTMATLADANVASQAASFAIQGSDPYSGQVAAAALGSAAALEAHAAEALTSIVSSGASEEVRVGAMLNALAIPDPDAELVTALLSESHGDTEFAEMATMVAGSLAGRSSDAAVRSLVSAELESRAVYSDAAVAGLDNLRRAERKPAAFAETDVLGAAGKTVEPRPSLRSSSDKVAARGFQTCFDDLSSPECWMDMNCGVPELPEGAQCVAAAQGMCSFAAGNAAWDDFCDTGTGTGTDSGTGTTDPDPDPDPTDCDDAICFWDVCEQVMSFDACGFAFVEHCLDLAWANWTPQPPEGWSSCQWPTINPADDIGGTGGPSCSSNCSAFAPPEPGDLMWDLVMGPSWAQGHLWTGIRPGGGDGARLASASVEAGVELRSNGTIKPLIFGKAGYSMDMTDGNSADNLDLAGMTVGQIERRLEVRADWLGDTIYSKTMDFPCGVGASDQLFPGVDITESSSWEEESSPLSATKGSFLENIVWSGPAVEGSVPVLGVVSISLGIGVSARVSGDWSWSLDMCDALTSNVLGTAAAQVKITGSVDVQAYAGVEFILIEAGVGVRATIFRVDAPLKASVQLINDSGTLRLRPCFSFTITPTAWDVHAYAYAKVFINLVFKKIVLWHKEVTLFSFNLGEEAGLGGGDGTWEVFASECDAVDPSPPIIVADDGEPPFQLNGFFKNPLMNGPSGSLPIGLPGSDGSWNTPVIGTPYRTPVQKVLDAFCAVMGLDASIQAPVIVPFEVTDAANAMYFTDVYEEDPETGAGIGSWITETSGSRVEQMQCGAPIANDEGDITITAEVERYLGWVSADNNTSELKLEIGNDYPVRILITNNSDEDHLITSVSSDGQPVLGCVDMVLAANTTETCSIAFIALPDPEADPYDDMAITSHYVAVSIEGEPTEHHAWHHGIDWSGTGTGLTPYLQIFGLGCGLCDTVISPGPNLGTGGELWTSLAIESQHEIVSADPPAPFDVLSDCTIDADGKSIACQGLVDYPRTTNYGPHQLDVPVTVRLPNDVEQTMTVTTWWYAHYNHPPDLSVSTTIGWQAANTYPGPDLHDAANKDILFTVANANPYGEITEMTATWTAAGSTSTSALCEQNSTNWTCEDPGADLPNTGQIEEGSVTIRAVWGPDPSDFTEFTTNFWFQPGVTQPVFCDANDAQGLTCGIAKLSEVNVLDENYGFDRTWANPDGSIVGMWAGGPHTGVVIQVVDRVGFDALWPGLGADETTMLQALNELEEASTVDIIMINGFRVAPESQIDALIRSIAANYDTTSSGMGNLLVTGGMDIGFADYGNYDSAPLFLSVLFDSASGSRIKLRPIEDLSLFVGLPTGVTNDDVAEPSQLEALNYWDLVRWVNVALARLAQHDAMAAIIRDELAMPPGATPFVQTNEFVTSATWSPGDPMPNPIRRNLLVGAIQASDISEFVTSTTGGPSSPSADALAARCELLGGCDPANPYSVEPFMATDISAIGWQTMAGESIKSLDGPPPESSGGIWTDTNDLLAHEVAWYRGCDWLCDEVFDVGQIDIVAQDYAYLETWRASDVTLLYQSHGTLIVRILPGQPAGAVTSMLGAVSTSSDALAALNGLVDSGVVELLMINNRLVGHDPADVGPMVVKMVADHSQVASVDGVAITPGTLQTLAMTATSPRASVGMQVCTSIPPFVFAARYLDASEAPMRVYFYEAETMWDAVNFSGGWDIVATGYHDQRTYMDILLTINHELVHVRQLWELQALVRAHPEAAALVASTPDAGVGLASDTAMYNDCDNDETHGYEDLPSFDRAIESAAVRFVQDMVSSSGEAVSENGANAVAGQCQQLDCNSVYLSAAFPMYGVVYGPDGDGTGATVFTAEFSEQALLDAMDPTN
jgi:hypothetical protein